MIIQASSSYFHSHVAFVVFVFAFVGDLNYVAVDVDAGVVDQIQQMVSIGEYPRMYSQMSQMICCYDGLDRRSVGLVR